jgi:hypothetical protein
MPLNIWKSFALNRRRSINLQSFGEKRSAVKAIETSFKIISLCETSEKSKHSLSKIVYSVIIFFCKLIRKTIWKKDTINCRLLFYFTLLRYEKKWFKYILSINMKIINSISYKIDQNMKRGNVVESENSHLNWIIECIDEVIFICNKFGSSFSLRLGFNIKLN